MYVCSLDNENTTARGIAYKNEDILYQHLILGAKTCRIKKKKRTTNKGKRILINLGGRGFKRIMACVLHTLQSKRLQIQIALAFIFYLA